MRVAHASVAECTDILRLIRKCRIRRYCEEFAFAVTLGVFDAPYRLGYSTARSHPAASALADDPNFAITLKNNQFVPSEVQIPAGVKVKLVVRNENPTTSEFESNQFHREKVVTPGQEITRFRRTPRSGQL